MFVLDELNKKLLQNYIDKNLNEVLELGHYTDDFGYIFETTSFLENQNFGFIIDVLNAAKNYIKQKKLPIEKLSLYYDLMFPLNITYLVLRSIQEEDLLYFIHDWLDFKKINKHSITPPKLTLIKNKLEKWESSYPFESSWFNYNLQSIPKNFLKNDLGNIKAALVTSNTSDYLNSLHKNSNDTTIWFELIV